MSERCLNAMSTICIARQARRFKPICSLYMDPNQRGWNLQRIPNMPRCGCSFFVFFLYYKFTNNLNIFCRFLNICQLWISKVKQTEIFLLNLFLNWLKSKPNFIAYQYLNSDHNQIWNLYQNSISFNSNKKLPILTFWNILIFIYFNFTYFIILSS